MRKSGGAEVTCWGWSDLPVWSTRDVSPTKFIVELSLDASEGLIEVFFVAALDVSVDDIFGRLRRASRRTRRSADLVRLDTALRMARGSPHRSGMCVAEFPHLHSSKSPSSQLCFDMYHNKNKQHFLDREIDDEIHALKKAVR
jgi:hypothetical protein